MAEIKEISQITTAPGVQRDGTNLDSNNYTDAQWCRFQRGRPKKMGGYQEITAPLKGVVRAMLVWTRGIFFSVVSASSTSITQASIDPNGVTGTTYDRTPAGLPDLDGCWTLDTMYDDAVGSQNTIIVAHRNNALANIDDTTDYPVYFGVASDTAAFTPIAGLSVSGGIVAIPPYLVYYGSDGLVGWSDANQPQTLTSGDAGSDRVTGAKVVKGLQIRSGAGPAALLWSLDSVIRMEYIGGGAIFRFSTVSAQSSILSQNSVIEYDGDYFWVGIDRFLAYAGGKVQELPNPQSKNWFFDNLNYAQRQKVWVTKIPRFGEIIWFFPFGDSEECNKAIVFNVSERTWYDFELSRSAGNYSQVFNHPIWASKSSQNRVLITVAALAGNIDLNDNLTIGTNSYTVVNELAGEYALESNSGASVPMFDDAIVNNTQAGTGTVATVVTLSSPYVHEKGVNAVVGELENSIESYFETSDFGYPTGGAQPNTIKGLNRYTRLIRVEPDFLMEGDMTVEVIGREFAQSPDIKSLPFTFNKNTGKIDIREQRRQIRLRFTSDTLNGDFEMGRTILHTEPGDVRA